jgi:CDP-diacylglycerol--glycerol-3-phosphate 3-phosphatidyltransferase
VNWDQYAVAWAHRHGGYDQRRATAPVRGWLRAGYGLARLLAALRVRPATVTVLGLVLAAAVPFAAARGAAGGLVAAGLVLASNLASTSGRALGVLTGAGAPRAAIGQALADRLGEVGWLVGFWVLGVPGLPVLACGLLSGLYEYARVHALAAGMSVVAVQTAADRPMRVAVAVVGLLLAVIAGFVGGQLVAGMLTVSIMVWLLFTVLGLSQLHGALRRSLR